MEIEIYTKDNCSFCEQAKQMIKQKCLEYTEHYLNEKDKIDELFERVGHPVRSVPQIFIDSEYIGGYNEFNKIFKDQDSLCIADT